MMNTRSVMRFLSFILIILLSGCSYLTTGETSIILVCLFACIALTTGFVDWNQVRYASPDNVFILMILIGIVFSQVLYSTQNSVVETLVLFLRIVAAYMITRVFTTEEFSKKYILAINVTTVFAILIWAMRNFGIDVPGIEFANINGAQYKTIFFCSWMLNSNRLMGIFWEPGLYSSSAIFSMILASKYLKGAEQKLSYIISIIGILLSQSTAGYILLILSLYFVSVQNKNHRAIVDYILLAVCLLLFFNYEKLVQAFLNLNPDVFWKLSGNNLTTNTRLNSPIACLEIFKKSPLTGVGLRYGTDLYSAMKSQFHMDALTATSFFYLAAYGIWGISYSVLTVLAVFRRNYLSFPLKIILLVIVFLILNKEPHYSIAVTYVFLFFYSRDKIERREEDTNASSIVD